jgi:hypothetical protein
MMPDDPQQRRTLIIQLALIAAIITMVVIVAASRYLAHDRGILHPDWGPHTGFLGPIVAEFVG